MTLLTGILTGLLWLCCILIVGVVLLQTGKSGGLGGVFGGGAGPDSLLGTRAMSFLVKVTVILCVTFLVLVLVLNRMSRQELSREKYETPPPVQALPESSGEVSEPGDGALETGSIPSIPDENTATPSPAEETEPETAAEPGGEEK